jgi:hypothetical protein
MGTRLDGGRLMRLRIENEQSGIVDSTKSSPIASPKPTAEESEGAIPRLL